MARDLRLQIDGDASSARRALDATADESDKAARKIGALSREMKQAAVSSAGLDGELKGAARAVNKLGDEAKGAERQMSRLDRQILETKLALKGLGDEFKRTGDAKIGDEFNKQSRGLAKLEAAARKIKKLDDELAPKNGGGGFLGGLFGNIAELFGGGAKGGAGLGASAAEGGLSTPILGPALLTLGAAAAVPAGAFLGSAVGGGILAGGGLGVAAGGLAGAFASDPVKYQAKWDQVVDHIQKRWVDSSKAFSDELDAGLKLADTTLRNIPVEKLLAVSQSFVKPVTEGAAGGGAAAVQGFADALENAQPVVDKLGPAIGELGHDVGDFFRATSMGSKGAADGLSDAVRAIGYVIKASGILILGLEHLYEGFRNTAKGAYEFATKMPGTGPVLKRFVNDAFRIADSTQTFGHTLDSTAASSHKFGSSLVEAAKSAAAAQLTAEGLNDTLTKTRDIMLGIADSNVAVAQGWIDLKGELKDGAKSLDLNSQAGIYNQKAILSQIKLLEEQRQKTIQLGGNTQTAIDQANAAFQSGIDQIKKMAHEAGFSDQKVDELIASLGLVPPQTTANVEVTGLSSALGQGISLGNALNNIDGRTYHATVSFSLIGGWVLDAARSVGAHARGGTFATSGPKKVGEHGQELIWGSRGEYVSTAEETRKLMSMAGGSSGGGSGSSPVALHVAGGADQGVGRLVQYLIDRGYIQAFAGGQLLTTRRS